MDSAKFKTIRESLGLDVDWLAEKAGVNRRTWQRWETERQPPKDVVAILQDYQRLMIERISDVLMSLKQVEEQQGTKPKSVELIRYAHYADMVRAGQDDWPPGMYNALLANLSIIFELEAYPLNVTYVADEPIDIGGEPLAKVNGLPDFIGSALNGAPVAMALNPDYVLGFYGDALPAKQVTLDGEPARYPAIWIALTQNPLVCIEMAKVGDATLEDPAVFTEYVKTFASKTLRFIAKKLSKETGAEKAALKGEIEEYLDVKDHVNMYGFTGLGEICGLVTPPENSEELAAWGEDLSRRKKILTEKIGRLERLQNK